jgi:phospholipid/cholesterol/gamma-HCH transport system substrate-binding protein
VRTTVAGVSSLAETLQGNRENIATIVTQMTSLSSDLSAFAAGLPTIGEKTATLLTAIDPEQVGSTVANINTFSSALAENSDDINAIVADARNVAARFSSLGDRAESLITKLDSMAGSGTGGILEDATTTLAAIREAADNFNTQVSVLGGGLGDFSDRGLRDIQSLVSEGQKTMGRLDRVITNLEQNPRGFLLGGERVPEYGGQRR